MTDSQAAAVSLECHEDGSVLVLTGAVGVAVAARLHAVALDVVERGLPVRIDCRAVDYVDGAVVQLLLGLDRALAARGVAWRFEQMPTPMRELLTLAGCDGLLAESTSSAASSQAPCPAGFQK